MDCARFGQSKPEPIVNTLRLNPLYAQGITEVLVFTYIFFLVSIKTNFVTKSGFGDTECSKKNCYYFAIYVITLPVPI